MRDTPIEGSPLAIKIALLILGGLLAVAAAESLRWPYIHDSPLMLYAGWHMAQGGVPYRDLFDMNMPGTYFAKWVLGAVFGWDDLGFRIFDLLCVAMLAGGTIAWLRPCGRAPALAASLLFPLWYLAAGPSTSMQREFLALVPLALAFGLGESRLRPPVRFFGTGLLVGAAALIKPQFVLLALPALIRMAVAVRSVDRPRLFAVMSAGLILPLLAAGAFLQYRGGLDAFVDIATNYWPLYTQLTGTHQSISGADRAWYLAESTLAGLMNPYIPLAIVGLSALVAAGQRRDMAWTIAGTIVAAMLYPALSGQFWTYHWLPFQYVLLSAAALAVPGGSPSRWTAGNIVRAAGASIALVAVGAIAVLALLGSFTNDPESDVVRSHARAAGVPAEVAYFLRSHLEPGDLVQPLDWTGGAVHAMLEARARLATRFMYDFHFYHHVNSAYIKRLRRQFLRQLGSSRPRFVIQVFGGRPWPAGAGTSGDFPALEAFLQSGYRVVRAGETYNILERVTPPAGDR